MLLVHLNHDHCVLINTIKESVSYLYIYVYVEHFYTQIRIVRLKLSKFRATSVLRINDSAVARNHKKYLLLSSADYKRL